MDANVGDSPQPPYGEHPAVLGASDAVTEPEGAAPAPGAVGGPEGSAAAYFYASGGTPPDADASLTVRDEPYIPPPSQPAGAAPPPPFHDPGLVREERYPQIQAQPQAANLGAIPELLVTIHCPGFRRDHQPDTQRTRIASGIMLAGFRNECRRLFPPDPASSQRLLLEEEIREAWPDGTRRVIRTDAEFSPQPDGMYEFVPLCTPPVSLRAFVRKGDTGAVRTVEFDDIAVPAFLPPNPSMLREQVIQRADPELQSCIAAATRVAAYLSFPGHASEVPFESYPVLGPAGQLPEGARIILQPQIELSVDSSCGPSIPFSIRPDDTWGSFLARITTAPPPLLAEISSRFALRSSRWLADTELARSPHLYFNNAERVHLALHPIVECQIFAFLHGQVRSFTVRLPGDVALNDLLEDLKRQAEAVLNFSIAGGVRVSLLASAGAFFGGGSRILPEQTLGKAGVRGGQAVLILCEDLTIDGIIELTT